MKKKQKSGRGVDGPQFETATEEIAHLRKSVALMEKTIVKMDKTIAELRKKNKEQAATIRDLQGAVAGYEKALKDGAREHAATRRALDAAQKRLDVVDNAHVPTSRQVMRESRKSRGAEDRKRTAERPGPPDGHPGTTDERPATHQVRAKFPACKNCNGRWIMITRMSEGSVTEVPRVTYQKIRMTSLTGNCVTCGHEVEGVFEMDDIREIRGGGAPPDRPGERAEQDADGKAPVRPGADQTVDVGGGLVQVRRADDGNAAVGDVVEAADTEGREMLDVPESGTLGFNLLHMILLEWRHRVTIRAIIDILVKLYTLGLSTATVWNALGRMARGMAPEYDAILADILRSPYLHVDETSFYVGKVRMWVWAVATREGVYYFVDSRSTDRIKEILRGYGGVLVVDGYHTFRLLPPEVVQRCTVHIVRDLKKWAENEKRMAPHRRIVRNFAARVGALVREAQDHKDKGRGPQMYAEMCARLDALLRYYDRYPEIKKYVNYVRNAGHRIFTFMNYEYVDSDNNLAERAMREVVKHRAVKSLLRTVEGAATFATLLTIMMTYGDSDMLQLLKKYLARGRRAGNTPDGASGNAGAHQDGPDMRKNPPDGGYG